MSYLLIVLINCVCFKVSGAFGTPQAIAVKGRVLCAGEPYLNVSVRLVDLDWESFPEKMDQATIDEEGYFVLNGTETEIFTIDPAVQFNHYCGTRLYPYCSQEILNQSLVEWNKSIATVIQDLGQIDLLGTTHECAFW